MRGRYLSKEFFFWKKIVFFVNSLKWRRTIFDVRVRLLNFIKFTSIRQKILRQLSLLFVIFSLVKIRLVRKYLKGPEVQNIINGLWTVLGWRLLKIKVNYFVLYILLYFVFQTSYYLNILFQLIAVEILSSHLK